MSYRHGNFSRGYDIVQYLLEDKSHTLIGAAKELGISKETARADFYTVYFNAQIGMCHEPSKTLKMFAKAYAQLHPKCIQKAK